MTDGQSERISGGEETQMSARIREIEQRPADTREPRPTKRSVVAEILSDGSVRQVGGSDPVDFPKSPFATGRLAGEDWILWWERRAWPNEAE
jgi:hypothetical protein